MEYLVLSLLAAAYLVPFFWAIYLGIKHKEDFMFLLCWMPIINLCMVGSFYDSLKEEKIKKERKDKGQAEIEATDVFYRVRIDFLDGTNYLTMKSTPYWSEWGWRVVTSKERCEDKVTAIIKAGYFESKEGIKYPFHTMKSLTIVEFEE